MEEEAAEEGSHKDDNSLVSEAEAAAAAAAAGLLTDDLIMEILSRLPVRSVHRFKCVCKRWRDLIACPAHREKLPQTLAGFLYTTYPGGYRHHLAAVVSAAVDPVDASLAFLRPRNYTRIRLVDTCNGLLLCSCTCYSSSSSEERLVVCNPATQRWTELPPPPQPQPTTDYCAHHLAFDPAVSPSHFRVLAFEATVEEWHLTGVSVYSSTTRAWTARRDVGLVDRIVLASGSVFAGGMLHLPGKLCEDGRNSAEDDDSFVLVVVDSECRAWKTVRAPRGFYCGAVGLSRGRLHYVTRSSAPLTILDDDNEDTLLLASEVAVWCLKDYDDGSQEWVLKHTVRVDKLLNVIEEEYTVVGIHPDCDTIFLVTRGAYDGDSWDDASLASWDMRRLEFRTVANLEKGSAGVYLPYVPMFSESTLADGGDL
jgi:hypothetical protein